MVRPKEFKVINGEWVPIYEGEKMSVLRGTPFEELLDRLFESLEQKFGFDGQDNCECDTPEEQEQCDKDCPVCIDPDEEC